MTNTGTRNRQTFLFLLACAVLGSANGNAFFSNGRRGSSWTVDLRLSSTPNGKARCQRQKNGRCLSSQSRSVHVGFSNTHRIIDNLRGGARGGGGDDDSYYNGGDDDSYYGKYNNDQDDDRYSQGGGYYGSYNDSGGNYGSSQPSGYSNYQDDFDDGRSRGDSNGKGSYYQDDDDERYRDYDYGGDRYDDDRRPTKSKNPSSTIGSMHNIIRNGNKKYGLYLLGGGSVLTVMGMALFFNKALMRLGNLLVVAGVPMFIGPNKTMKMVLDPSKLRATGCVGFGVFLVFVGWPILGIIFEIFGVLNLFGNMFPFAMMMLRNIPIIGSLVPKNDRRGSGRNRKGRRDYDDDYYGGGNNDYDDGRYDDGNDDGYGGGGYY